MKQLQEAIEKKDVVKIQSFLNDGGLLRILFCLAADKGVLSVVRYLIEGNEIDIINKQYFGLTLLHRAAKGGYLELVKYSIEHGADVTITSKVGKTALDYAKNNKKAGDIVAYLQGVLDAAQKRQYSVEEQSQKEQSKMEVAIEVPVDEDEADTEEEQTDCEYEIGEIDAVIDDGQVSFLASSKADCNNQQSSEGEGSITNVDGFDIEELVQDQNQELTRPKKRKEREIAGAKKSRPKKKKKSKREKMEVEEEGEVVFDGAELSAMENVDIQRSIQRSLQDIKKC